MNEGEERELELEEKSSVDGVPQYHRHESNLTVKILKKNWPIAEHMSKWFILEFVLHLTWYHLNYD